MRNVFLFLKKYSILLLFLLLQGMSLYILFNYNGFQHTVFSMFNSEMSGKINTKVNNIEEYFSLKKENEQLRAQNALLMSYLPSGIKFPDTAYTFVTDTAKIDSISVYRQFKYMSAKVISNSVFLQQNYLMLHRGSDQGVEPNMAVIGSNGIIGTVINASKNMSTVMSLLHRQSKLIAVMKGGSGLGEVSWDGKDPSILILTKIPITIIINKGDTVVTSPYSDKFPPGLPVGFVEKIDKDQETNTYILRIKTATDFYSIQHSFVVKNLLQDQIDELNRKLIKE